MSQTFEKLEVRKTAKELCLHIYKIFKELKDYGFKDQLQRSSISVMNNIAEGYERNGESDKRRFMIIAKGSIAETRSMIHIAHDLGYINTKDYEVLLGLCQSVGKMLFGLIKKLSL